MSSFQKVLELSIPQEQEQHYWVRTQEQNWMGCYKNLGQGRRKNLELGQRVVSKSSEQEQSFVGDHHNLRELEQVPKVVSS